MQAPRRVFIEIGLAALLFAAGYGTAEYSAPARIETKVVTVDRSESKAAEKLATTIDENKKGKLERVENYKRTTLPTGTVVEEGQVVYRAQTEDQHHQALAFSLDQTVAVDHWTESTKIITSQPRWTIGIGAGGAFALQPLGVTPAYTAFGTYRFAGPFSAGVIALAVPGRAEVAVLGIATLSF